MDPLSDVLSLLRPRSYFSAGLDAGGDWAIQFQGYQGIKFNAVVTGDCWLTIEGEPTPLRLKEGDCFLLSSGSPFCLASDLSITPIDAEAVYATARDGVACCNEGGEFLLMGSRFELSPNEAGILLDMLPPVIHIQQSSDQASVLRWTLERITREARDQQPGSLLVIEHLAHLMLIQVLRLHGAGPDVRGVGWLFALRDRHLRAAIGVMHAQPGRRWTLQELARQAGLSRSIFSLRFKEAVGVTPMDYLAGWRMSLARDRLVNSADGVGAIGRGLGFASESAFCAAFRREMGCSPRQYSAQARSAAPAVRSGRLESFCERAAAA